MDSKELLQLTVEAADDKRADDIVALDVAEVSLMADYFVILSADSKRQVQAIADNIVDFVRKAGSDVKSVEGRTAGEWVLIDAGDVIVHVFQKDARAHYNLEKLWSDALIVDVVQWVNA
ncbi:ribosome silencing factor [Lactiplantibacillus plantarum]|uniref:ribosome silencing factor n=1 Tax=Lactiplantibacillus plantarum TaxID=1590 RepID=UPI001D099048|nr:ribosome silencing factor [Lactiplantibacillus plantarum]MCB7139178.1 ribosome silencing factor [Lactiplantibacillus plantarum]MCB7158301.1 ribosome silencing factor [Lactiplantibacillus plantarum]MCB7164441.1 ribosome silencing factor [Lactiplantibacillus plantarum]MCB7168357.1 ribosome silencing factor [Lactiplantibacillus plantarum]MCB7173599.1 ribosome silencing factor [Lactiplantibacillus plantarum]